MGKKIGEKSLFVEKTPLRHLKKIAKVKPKKKLKLAHCNQTKIQETPSNFDTNSFIKLLNSLLPKAKITSNPGDLKSSMDINKTNRSSLVIGCNAVNKSLRKGITSGVIFDKDIEPKHLISHTHSLCTHNGVPYLVIDDFRFITKKTLGFECIALGFKSTGDVFNEIREAILLYGNQKVEVAKEIETQEIDMGENVQKSKPFQYMYRADKSQRTFIPSDERRVHAIQNTSDIITLD